MSMRIQLDKADRVNYTVYCAMGFGKNITYSVLTTHLLLFLTISVGLSAWELIIVAIGYIITRLFDAVTDPLIGFMVDNTKSKYGKHKPWIAIGAILHFVTFLLLFIDYRGLFGMATWAYLLLFFTLYVINGLGYSASDMAYRAILPTLSTENKKREWLATWQGASMGIGMLLAISVPTLIYGPLPQWGFFIVAAVFGTFYLISQFVVVFFVNPKHINVVAATKNFSLSQMRKVVFKNDQMLVVALVLMLFMTGHILSSSFGMYFVQFVLGYYGGPQFILFVIIMGGSFALGFMLFRVLSNKFSFKQIYVICTIIMCIGLSAFLMIGDDRIISVDNALAPTVIFGAFGFFGIGMIFVMMQLLLANTVEYGQLKFGIRNEGIVSSMYTLMAKFADAVATFVLAILMMTTGFDERILNRIALVEADARLYNRPRPEVLDEIREFISYEMSNQPLIGATIRTSMALIPLILVIAGMIVFCLGHKMSKQKHALIVAELEKKLVTSDDRVNTHDVNDGFEEFLD